VKCLQCHNEVEMHELRHHVEEVHGKIEGRPFAMLKIP